MDAGLGVRWPLSPYATALAAGAIFAFCIALWKRRAGVKHRTVVDPSGPIFGKDLDPKKERDACDKPGGKEDEGKAEGIQNFPVLAHTRRLSNYESLCLSGRFGAIPRTLQRNQTLENPNLYSVIRRRNTPNENNNWRETSSTSSNFSCIYQQSLYFASELPRLNARFLFNLSPHLQPYIRQFGYAPNPEVSRSSDFDHFDVAIKPEILKNKPITRSAVCLALQSQLYKYLEEPYREKRINERSIQTADITEENDDDSAPDNKISNECELNADSDIAAKSEERPCSSEFSKNTSSDSSLWDSGYGEKAFDERCHTPKECCDENNILMEEIDDTIRAEFKTTSEKLNIIKYSDLLKETNKNDFLVEENDGEEICDNASTFSEKSIDNESFVEEESNDDTTTIEYSTNNLNISETSDSPTQQNDSECSTCDKILEVSGCDTIPQFSSEHASELNPQREEAVTNFSDTVAVSDEKIKKLSFDENVDVLQINKCSDKELGTYHDNDMQMSSMEENNLQPIHNPRNDSEDTETLAKFTVCEKRQSAEGTKSFSATDLERVQDTISSRSVGGKGENKEESSDENLFRGSENTVQERQNSDDRDTRALEVDAGVERGLEKKEKSINFEDLERIQNEFDSALEEQKQQLSIAVSPALEAEKRNSRVTENAAPSPPRDVTEEGASRDPPVLDERGTFNVPHQMDRETGERSVAVESTVTTETTLGANGDARLSTAVVSRLTLDDWEDSLSVKTTVNEEVYRPTFEEFVPLKSGRATNGAAKFHAEKLVPLSSRNGSDKKEQLDSTRNGNGAKVQVDPTRNGNDAKVQIDPTQNGNNEAAESELPSSPRVDRLKGLLNRDEERRTRSKFHHLPSDVGGAMEGEWDRLLRDVLASVSELERWERRHCDDVSSDAEDAEHQHPFSQSDSSFAMEEETLSPSSKGETPTKVKNLRFKLDPDVFDVPSDDSFYDDENDDENRRGYYKKQPKYRAFSSLELHDEPVRLVSVQASVVPAGQKMVARPVGIDLRVRLTEERQSKRAHVSTSPSQAKRRSPVSDRGIGWCQELSPVTENVDWRESFTPVTPECKGVLNGILKTPSPKIEPSPIESPNPFKLENGVTTNGVTPSSPVSETKNVEKPKYNGWKPPVERKPFLIIRKKFEPDPEAIERITGYKIALSKPPLPPPPVSHKNNLTLSSRLNRIELARKQYLDNKAALAANKVDGTKKFQQFLYQAQNDRAKIVTSVPDLVAIERAVTEQWTKERSSVSPRESPSREDYKKSDGVTLSRGSTPDDKWASYVQSCRQHLGRRSQSMTYLETDIDVIPILDADDKYHSTSALDEPDEALPDPDDSDLDASREDLDDSGRAKSEHELRIERSLRSLPLPDWYRKSDKTKTGFLLGSSNKEKRGWAAAKSLASSTSSLASCGLRRPVRSLRSSRENIPWSRTSASPDGPTLSLALAKAFREPYLGWRARTPTSSGVSSSPRASPPSWGATTTDDEANGVSFDGEDAFGRTTSSEDDKRDEPLSLDDTGADAVTVSMDTNDPVKLPAGEDTYDDINNMSMDTCELFDASVVVPVDEDPSPQADTGDDIDNLSTDTTTTEGRKLNDPKLKRYSYSQSIYHSEWDEEEESRGERKVKKEERETSPASSDHKVVWIESSFVGSRTTTSIMVLPEKKAPGSTQERPASR